MTNAEEALYDTLRRLDVPFSSLEHPAVFTVAESAEIHHAMPGLHTKNLFLKDEGGAFWLVTAPADAAIDIKALRHKIGSKRLSFGKAEAMAELLGVEPGSVTPLAVINDTGGAVTLVLDAALTGEGTVNIHPLRNTATIGLKGTDLVRAVAAFGHLPKVVETTGD
ncbi:MAG TPA: prolyl-tRNA synthetase associated domain-containing protein [Alphaproteobacteria bacterium]|jgi:Ala-tRNA(Pro) deacylase|nr:prolyl-tRNA synthetase associated domain-containing protein [Alphaproteobacteria bacterium]